MKMKLNQLINKYQGVEHRDIILLLEKILDATYSRLLLADDIKLNTRQENELESYIHRLKSDEPIQYIIGEWDFIDLKLKVDSRALIPRPETEILAQEGVRLAQNYSSPRVLDIGCGTGCIGLYIKHAVPKADVTLCDICADAISLARENAQSLNLDVNLIHTDMKHISGVYDIIVSNPPYITKGDMESLDKSVADYEPQNALYGGEDGLEFYKTLSDIHNSLTDCGYLAVEIGINQSDSVKKLLENNFEDIIVKKDFADIERIIIAKKKTNAT